MVQCMMVPSDEFHQAALNISTEDKFQSIQRFPCQPLRGCTNSHMMIFIESQSRRVHHSQQFLTGQRQRLLQLLQMVVSLCDHHPDCILVCGGLVPLELISCPVSEVLPVRLVRHLPYGPQHVSVNPQNPLSL